MIVDIHAHAVSERFLSDLQRQPIAGISAERGDDGTYFMQGGGWDRPSSIDVNLHDLPHRLQSLRRRKVELQLFAPSPGFFSWPGGAADREWVRALHAQEIELAAQSEGLMEPMVVFPLGEPEHVADEVRRAMDLYPFRAGMLPSTAGGRPLDDPIFEPMWSLIEELGLVDLPASDLGGRFRALRPLWRARPGGLAVRDDARRHAADLRGRARAAPGTQDHSCRTAAAISFSSAGGSIPRIMPKAGRRTPTIARTSAVLRARISTGSTTIPARSASKAIASWSTRWAPTGSCSAATIPSTSEIRKASARFR